MFTPPKFIIMKKIIILFVLAITLFSCSDNSSSSTNPNLLQRVDFNPGTPNERRWNFSNDGLLTTITDANAALIEKFVYDSNNNVIQDIKYSSGSPTENYLISYNSSNKITNINSRSYNYSASDNRYYYTAGNESFSCELNADGLATHYSDFFDFPGVSNDIQTEFTFQYESGNLLSMSGFGSSMSDVIINFTYGNSVNPLKNATLPVFRIKSLINPNFFNTGICSNNVKATKTYAPGDPESSIYGMLIYPSGKIELLTDQSYSGSVLESSLTDSYYYYQGDVIP